MHRSAADSAMAVASGRRGTVVVVLLALSVFTGCDWNLRPVAAIKATVSGLKGSGLELWMNGHDPVAVEKDGEVTLAYMVSGYYYSVSVKTQPTSPAQTCTVENATGVMGSADVTNVAVSCVTSYAIGGTANGLDGSGLVLHSSLGDDLSISRDGSFVFPTRVAAGTEYVVTVKTQPTPTPPKTSETCSVGNAQGIVGNSDVLNVTVICSTDAFKVGGTVSGLADNATVVLRNNGTDDLTATANGSFTFATAVASGASYQVTVKTQPPNPWQDCVVDNGTGTISSTDVTNVAVTCTTRMFATAVPITNNAGSASGSRVAMDSNGNALVVWEQSDGTRENIWANRYDAVVEKKWGTAMLIDTGNADEVRDPQIAMDSFGNGMAVWCQKNGESYNIYANRYVFGSGWAGAQLIKTDNAGRAFRPQVAMDSAGNAMAVWVQSDGTRYDVWANRYVLGSEWGTAQLIETDNTGNAMDPQVAMDDSGNAVAVWKQSDGTRYNIWASRYVIGSGWSTAQLIETDNSGHASDPQVAIDVSGNAMVVWHQADVDETRKNVWANRFTVGSGWGTAQLIEIDNTTAEYPQVAMDGSGNAVAVWYNGGISANRYVAGSGWGTVQLVGTGYFSMEITFELPGQPRVAMDFAGNAIAVWEQRDETGIDIRANRYVIGSGWSKMQLIGDYECGLALSCQPQIADIAMNASGNAIAVWSQYDGTRDNIWASHY